MDIYDTASVQKVWQRVGLTSGKPESCPLSGLITHKQSAQQIYCSLAHCSSNFRCLAQQTAEQLQKLQAIHFMQTGKAAHRACPRREPVRCTPCFLRQLIENTQADARMLRELAQQMEAYRSPLLCMAAADDRAAQVLLTELARRM